jgi:purine nucleosidase
MPETIIIDTDPGQDDAVAILLAIAAKDRLDLRAIMAVAGNAPVTQTTANAIRICELAQRTDVPVLKGAEGPLVFPLETAEFVCGPDGLAGANLPQPKGPARKEHAVTFLIEYLRAEGERTVTLCTLGPLTNIAMALRLAPEIKSSIKRIILMGGAMNLGNMTPAAEYNFYVDPQAAGVVLNSGIPLVMLGLNLTHQAVGTSEHNAAFAAFGTATGRAIHGMLTRPRPGGLGTKGHPLHDPCVIAFVLWPDLFTGRDCHVEIDMSDGPLRGRSTVDWNGRLKKPANAFVVDTVDSPALFDRMIKELSMLP